VNSTRARKALDRLAYASLVLDICIALITTLTILDHTSAPQPLLFPIDYLLTIVVALSIIMFIVLLLFRSMEKRALKAMDKDKSPDPDSKKIQRQVPRIGQSLRWKGLKTESRA
jgi:hypothetical protein